ncbi:MAG: hypothetical protein ACRYFA_05880 [Janthinobacterium lividum]
MRKIILITVFLFLIVIVVTGLYFSRIKLSRQNITNVISQIPQDAALVFEFKNDSEFYELFKENNLLTSFIGQKKAEELKYLHDNLLKNNILNTALLNQSIYISLHSETNSGNIEMLLTTSSDGITDSQKTLETIIEKTNGAFEVEKIGSKTIQKATFPALKEVFYITNNAHVLAGSFSKALLLNFLDERVENKVSNFTQISDQRNKNSLANLYVNYTQFPVLFKQLFRYQNDDFFRLINNFQATAALSLNFKSDALLFNGYTKTDTTAVTYLNIFIRQKPVTNTIKAVYPINTASAVSFAYGNTTDYLAALYKWQIKLHHNLKANTLYNQIKKETGITIQTAFNKQLGNEFSLLTTAENEKLAIIKVKNGSELEPYLRNLSVDANSMHMRLKYENLPFYLLGEPFLHFKQPYFVLIDNYLVLSNSENGIEHYLNNYQHQHFLNEDGQYYNFDALLAEQSNVSFFIHLPNSFHSLKKQLQPKFAQLFDQKNSSWKNYYAAALQFTASESSFYTNFYLQNRQDTVKRNSSISN